MKREPDKIVEHRVSTPLRQTHSLGLVAFVLTIVGLFTSFFFPFFFQIIGLVLGHIALSDYNRNEENYSGKGLIIASLIINYIVIALAILMLLIVGIGFFAILGAASS
tara:strand:- start:4248 stop:4571 length:324 start_codon:yes stop_codon:yes gene_type:complete